MSTLLPRLKTVIAGLALTLSIASPAAAIAPRASLTDIESDVMCVVCKTPLAVSQSPEAGAERALITKLINLGETKAQIEKAMVAQYGPAVLGLPPARGFNLTVYILPPAVVIIGVGLLLFTLPKWRRRSRARAQTPMTSQAALDPSEALRLETDLRRFD